MDKYDKEEIKFWRTIQKKEMDFVVAEKFTLEVKAQVKSLKMKDYKLFLESYPEIKFNFVSFDCAIKKILGHPLLEVWQI